MKFSVKAKDPDSSARACVLETAHSTVETPVFMPVATRGAIRALTMEQVREIGFDIILSNTYHLYIRPGTGVLENAGGLHRFMDYGGSILTDSGGFQVFSLSDLCKIKEDGVEFSSHLDGSRHFFTPEKVLDVQRVIGSDIMMVLDQCTDYPIPREDARAAMERTIRWARSSIDYYNSTFDSEKQACFGIIQGSVYNDLRKECALRLGEMDFPGYAIGGLSVGEPKELYREVTGEVVQYMPEDKPRYMMGVGSPMEILYGIRCGVDMFDCVMPTRIARNGTLYTSQGRVNIKSAAYENDFSPLDPECGCPVCRTFSKAYLRHIFKAGEISALIYNTYHNLYFMKKFMEEVRQSVTDGTFTELYERWARIF